MKLWSGFNGLSKKKKIQIVFFSIVVLLLIGLAAWKVIKIWAESIVITNQATITYNDGTGTKVGTSNVAQTEVTAPSANATLTFSPVSGSYNVGQNFNVDIMINTAGQDTVGVNLDITYDASALQVQDADANTAGVQIQPGTLYSLYPTNSASSGKITFDAIINPGEAVYNGTGKLATITFKGLKEISASAVNFSFTTGSTSDTNVTNPSGSDILGSVTNGSYTITPQDVNLTYKYTLQGRTNYSATGVSLMVFPNGSSSAVFSSSNQTVSSSGNAQLSISGLSAGSYDFRIKVNTYLAKKLTNRAISPAMSLDFGNLLAGDLDNNNIVNSLDFSIMMGQWRQTGTADINQDGIVNTIDFAHLNSSWFISGD